MRIYYIIILSDYKVSRLKVDNIHDEIKYGIFYKKIKERIGYLYTPILSHILEPYT